MSDAGCSQDALTASNSAINGSLTSIGPISGADHLAMSYLPWQEQSFVQDGYAAGAIEWLLNQTRPEGGECARSK